MRLTGRQVGILDEMDGTLEAVEAFAYIDIADIECLEQLLGELRISVEEGIAGGMVKKGKGAETHER